MDYFSDDLDDFYILSRLRIKKYISISFEREQQYVLN